MRARAALERFARRWWAGELGLLGAILGGLAAPVSTAWAVAARSRAARYARTGGVAVEGLTVVSVGNLAVGGTGKTPVAAWVARRLAGTGTPTTLLAGGHGEDEALLHARWGPELSVDRGRDRVAAARRAREGGAEALVLDDGFQHFALARDLDVVLLSADDTFPGHVLPRGPYREPPEALGRAGAIVVTRRSASGEEARALAAAAGRHAEGCPTAGARLAPAGLRPLARWAGSAPADRPAEEGAGVAVLRGLPVLAVCAVARPETVAAAVAELLDGPVEVLAYPDHYRYGPDDVARVQARAAGRPVVVTEKDAVKLAPFAADLGQVCVLEEALSWEWGEEVLTGRLLALLGERVGR